LREFARDDTPVWSADDQGWRARHTLGELPPASFGPTIGFPMSLDDAVARSAERIVASGRRPRIARLLGSGWQPFVDRVRSPSRLPYAQLPAFPVLGVAGHAGELILGQVGAHDVVVLAGRKHTYESGDASVMKGVIATLTACGVTTLVQTMPPAA
jgi:purine-nucleoside phosphorylase